MVSTVMTAVLRGLEVDFVKAEVDTSNGLPVMLMVGSLSAEVKEAAERIRAAIRNMGVTLPPKKMIINLSPANVRKTGSAFDLPIALGILMSLGQVSAEVLAKTLVVGELGLDGEVRKVPGILPIVLEAKKAGYTTCILPKSNQSEGEIVQGIQVIGVSTLKEMIEYLTGNRNIVAERRKEKGETISLPKKNAVDYSEIIGQEFVKRAVEVAVAGRHNLLLIGPPGAGKTMIASRIPSIFPELTWEERMEISKVYSVLGMLDKEQPFLLQRPFRSVHHTITKTALIGGGTIPRPGEISLASGGVLFLDELAEFQKPVLEVLRQPLEERFIQITRSRGSYRFPADFFLVAAMNPCPCGNYPNLDRCTCTPGQIQGYLHKISQPFLDRMDICVEAPRIAYEDLKGADRAESSHEIRKRVERATAVQQSRYQDTDIRNNGQIPSGRIKEYCSLGKEEEILMAQAYTKLQLTARTYHKTLRVARTIADLSGAEKISLSHLREALSYRGIDKKYWSRI